MIEATWRTSISADDFPQIEQLTKERRKWQSIEELAADRVKKLAGR